MFAMVPSIDEVMILSGLLQIERLVDSEVDDADVDIAEHIYVQSDQKKENLVPTQSKIAELNESRTELLGRIQSLKQDLHNWRSKLDTQVQGYRNELVELRKSLNVEVDQLRSEFQELKTTLQQQQEDVNASLKNLGLQDPPSEVSVHEVKGEGNDVEGIEPGSSNDNANVETSSGKEIDAENHLSSAEVIGVDTDH